MKKNQLLFKYNTCFATTSCPSLRRQLSKRNGTTVMEFYPIMKDFRDKLVKRRKDRFYGYLTKVRLEQISASEANIGKADFQAFFSTAITYVEKWFNISDDSWRSIPLYPLSLKRGLAQYDQQAKHKHGRFV